MKLCACGCGLEFKPRRRNQLYMDRHRKLNTKTTVIRLPIRDAQQIRAKIARQNLHKSGVRGITAKIAAEPGLEYRKLKLAALWLKERLEL